MKPYMERSEIIVAVPVTYEVTEVTLPDLMPLLREAYGLGPDDALEMVLGIHEPEDEGWDNVAAYFKHLKVKRRIVESNDRMKELNR